VHAETDEPIPGYPFRNPGPLEPAPEWARLRRERPLARVRMASGDEVVLLTRYEDVRQILSDPRFSRQLTADDAAAVSDTEGAAFQPTPTPPTGEGHRRWRQVLGRTFSTKRMDAMRPRIVVMAEQLLDGMVSRGVPGDLVGDFGHPLPVWVICELLGLPADDRERFAFWSNTMLNLTRYSREEIEAAQNEIDEYFHHHIAAKRAEPGDDLLSELIAITDSGDGRLSEAELVSTGQILLVAGHETSANMIGKMVAMLLSDRRRWETLLADPSLVRSTVEEALRLDVNFGFGIPRYLSEPVEVGDTTLPRGTTVVCSVSAANRDENAFEDTENMELRRSPNPHLTFGVGPHSCLGQALARIELQCALEVLLRRLPSLELAVPTGKLRVRDGLIVGGMEELPVRW
jgi:cytochrome P450